MGWRDLIQQPNETLVVPWVGGRDIRVQSRRWTIQGPTPREHGWCRFKLDGRKAEYLEPAEPTPDDQARLPFWQRGFLVGDLLASETVLPFRTHDNQEHLLERVNLIEPGLDRFVRILAGRLTADQPLVYLAQEFPLGPEAEVLSAYLNRKPITDVKGVPPALELAFNLEVWRRDTLEKRRAELERLRVQEERRQTLVKQLGDAVGRRELAKQDFATAAKAALLVGNAEYLDHRTTHNRQEYVVWFRLDGRRFECVCDENLRIVDSGICLTAHNNEAGFEYGTKGDTWFTLESLPSVIRQAERERKLVVYRHADPDRERDENEDWDD